MLALRLNGATAGRALFATLLCPISSFAATVSGVVLDPQDLTVRGARVELVCADQVTAATTDQDGRFAIVAPSGSDCILSVTRAGFASFRQRLTESAGSLTVRLQVAGVEQHVKVVANPAPLRRPIGSVSLSSSERDLRTVAATTSDLIRYAQLLAGASTRPASIYVDGLPGGGLPPLDAIAQISIGADPFSAEHADGEVTSIEIITKAPARTLRFFTGGDLPGIGGRDVLAPALRTTSRGGNLGVMGPVPRLPLTFTASAGIGRTSEEMPIRVVLPDFDASAQPAATTNRNGSGAVGLYYSPTVSLRARVAFHESRASGANVGVGGVTLQEAGSESSFVTRTGRATTTKVGSRLLYEGGVIIGYADSQSRANSRDVGITVGGDLVMGGASTSDSRRSTMRWTSKHVVRSRSLRAWAAGIVMAGVEEANRQMPNSGGTFYFSDIEAYRRALAGDKTGTWYVTRGGTLDRFRNLTAAPFVQTTLIQARRFNLSGGVRADYQSGFGMLVSPRVSLATESHGLDVRAGAGMFVQNLPSGIFIRAMENDGYSGQQFIATDVSLADPAEALLRRASNLQSRIAAHLTRPRTFLWRVSVERPVGSLIPALEYSFAGDRHLLGSDRHPAEAGWADVFESNRRATRQRLHAQVRHTWKRHQTVVDYEFTRARDNTDGPFSFAEQPGHLTAEWARSAGVSPHSVTVMSTVALPAAISLNVVDTWRGSAPFNVTTAFDTTGNGLVLDRGGRARNSADGPHFHSLSLYAHVRMAWPDIFKAPRGTGIHVGVQADNLLNNRNYLAIGSIAGSATFGKPLAAYPGRSIRVLLSIN